MTLQSIGRWDPPRSILVLHDLSPQAGHAAWRAGIIARDHGAEVCLLNVTSERTDEAKVDLALNKVAGELIEALGIRASVRVVQGDPFGEALRAGREAGLVVIGSRRPNALREWVLGTPAERLIRLCGQPVLVVKQPARARYRRILVPVDLSVAGGQAVAAASALSSSPAIEVFHSLSTKNEITMRAADVPETEMRRYRKISVDRARMRISELIGTTTATAPLLTTPSVGFGSPSFMVLAKEQAMRAELIVIGKRRRGMLADFLLGSVTQRVLAGSRADVLVLPRWKAQSAGLLQTSAAVSSI